MDKKASVLRWEMRDGKFFTIFLCRLGKRYYLCNQKP